jgi:hypothetical protein
MRAARLPSLTFAILALASQLVPGQQPLVPRVVDVTPAGTRRPSEASVAINPLNPDHVVAVMMQSGGPGEPRVSNWAYTSVDGGVTWKGAAAQNTDQRVQGDDSVVFARDGRAFHGYISFDGIRVERPERASSGIYVRSSKDGASWNTPVAVVDHINTAIPFEDKPWVGVSRQCLRRVDAVRCLRQRAAAASIAHHVVALSRWWSDLCHTARNLG